jgi:hypothetical protein
MKKIILNIIIFGALLSSCSDNGKDSIKNEVEDKTDSANKTVSLIDSYSLFDTTGSAIVKSYLLSPISTGDTLHRYFYDKEKKQGIHNSGLGFFVMVKYADDFSNTGKVSLRFYAPNFYPYKNVVYFSQAIDTTINGNIDEFLKKNEFTYSGIRTKGGETKILRKIYAEIIDGNGFKNEYDFKLNINENTAITIDLFVVDKDDNPVFSKGHLIEFPLKNKDLKIFDGTFRFDFPKEAL